MLRQTGSPTRGRVRGVPGSLGRRLELNAMASARRNAMTLLLPRRDLTNGWQNSDGTGTAALAAPIGLLLDQQYGGALGSELVTNGGFDSGGSGWTPGAGWSVSSGAATMVSAQGSNTYVGQVTSFTSGRLYRVQYDLTVNSGQAVVYVGSGGIGVNRTATGTYTEYIQAGIGSTLYLFGIAGFTGSFDNVSVREVLGTHATQATTANKPLLTRVPRTLGPELHPDPSIATPGDWVLSTGWSIASGDLSSNSPAAFSTAARVVSLPSAGRVVQVTYTIKAFTSGTVRVQVAGGTSQNMTYRSAVGSYSETVVVLEGNGAINFQTGSGSFVGVIDNVSVREVLDWSYALSFDGANDLLSTSLSSGTTGTLMAAVQVASHNQTARVFLGNGANVDAAAGAMLRLGGNDKLQLMIGNGSVRQTLSDPTILAVGSHVVAARWSPTAAELWLDGVMVASGAVSGINTTSAAPFQIGAANSAQYCRDVIRAVAIDQDTWTPDSDLHAIGRAWADDLGIRYGA